MKKRYYIFMFIACIIWAGLYWFSRVESDTSFEVPGQENWGAYEYLHDCLNHQRNQKTLILDIQAGGNAYAIALSEENELRGYCMDDTGCLLQMPYYRFDGNVEAILRDRILGIESYYIYSRETKNDYIECCLMKKEGKDAIAVVHYPKDTSQEGSIEVFDLSEDRIEYSNQLASIIVNGKYSEILDEITLEDQEKYDQILIVGKDTGFSIVAIKGYEVNVLEEETDPYDLSTSLEEKNGHVIYHKLVNQESVKDRVRSK